MALRATPGISSVPDPAVNDAGDTAVVTAFPCGAFITTTPRCVAAATSMLSTPMPARPTTFSRGAASKRARVTLVAERTASPS